MSPAPDRRTRDFLVIGQDPAIRDSRSRIVTARVSVPAEELDPGPRGYRVSVVDYDCTHNVLYPPADLARRNGHDAYEKADADRLLGDPGFHAQNVYALVMRTLARFETALGRHVSWSFRYGHQLQVAPHAFQEANAFYSERDQALLFGYFPGRRGATIFSCLSHDVVVHEASHALLDGLRDRYTDVSLPDQPAFHEGFADVVALLSVFSIAEVMEELLRASVREARARRAGRNGAGEGRYRVDEKWLRRSALFRLADEMGQELLERRGCGLRNSLDLDPRPDLLDHPDYQEPHRRGEVLVGAVLTALVRTWARRLADLGIHEGGEDDVKAIRRIAQEGAAAAGFLLTIAIRALDYTPPIDVLFGDYLSAVLTADAELVPYERQFKFRPALLESFADYGIRPTSDARRSGLWQPPEADPNIEDRARLTYDRIHLEALQRDPDEVFRFLWENRATLGLYPGTYTRVMSLRPCVRVGPDGFVLHETVAEYEQMMDVRAVELARLGLRRPKGISPGTLIRLHGGGTLIFDDFGRLKFNVHKRLNGRGQQAKLDHLAAIGHSWEERGERTSGAAYFARLHRDRAVSGSA
jgi:hypothetical protein